MPATITPAAPAVTCPAWCALPAGHCAEPDGYDIDGTRFIWHRSATSDVEIMQVVEIGPDQVVEASPPEIKLAGQFETFTLAEAAHLAAELAAALTTAGGR